MGRGNFGFTGYVNISGFQFKGTWNATTNSPFLQSGVGVVGEYYIVGVAGTTTLDGINDWQLGDWAIFSDTNVWQKIDNHDVQAYTIVQNEGVSLPQRSVMDFQGTNVNATDNGSKTIVTITESTYGLYAQTSNSVPITNTIAESTLIGAGVGTLSIPPNAFSVGDSFRVEMGGVLSSKNNENFRLRIKTGSVVLADSGLQSFPLITNEIWQVAITFTIRSLGSAGVGSIISLGEFHLTKSSNNTQNGFAFNTLNNTTFDTTIGNTLNITAQWGSVSALNNIYSDVFVLNKIY